MIIFISPAKTFRETDISFGQKPYFHKDALDMIDKLKTIPIETIEKKMKISNKLAHDVLNDYHHFDENHHAAIFSYFGHQYRNFDISSIDDSNYPYLKDHLYILSGLYGIVNAFDDISHYRLEMQDKTLMNLYKYWEPKIHKFIQTKLSGKTIINLCSNEYGQLISNLDQTITVDFQQLKKNGKYGIHSMEVKKMRGLFARYLVTHPKTDIKSIVIEDYIYQDDLSNNQKFVFVKTL